MLVDDVDRLARFGTVLRALNPDLPLRAVAPNPTPLGQRVE
jgi:hypothetical protein